MQMVLECHHCQRDCHCILKKMLSIFIFPLENAKLMINRIKYKRSCQKEDLLFWCLNLHLNTNLHNGLPYAWAIIKDLN